MRFDADGPEAAATRHGLLAARAEDGERIAGMHLPFPGVGRVVARGAGFAFAPQV